MKKALITGITGQDGSYLAELLLDKGYEVYGMVRRTSTVRYDRISHIQDKINIISGDMTDQTSLTSALRDIQPEEVYNLAAQSFVPASWAQPSYTGNATALGVTRLLDAIRAVNPEIRMYQASSSEMFGKVRDVPQTEDTPFYPRSPYAAAKIYAYWITVNYREAYGMHASNGILFNHESPMRGETFVTRKITRAVAAIKLGYQETLYLGNLDAKRDWGHAREYVEGMWRIVQHPEPDDFVLGTGETHSVREFVEKAFALVDINIEWRGAGVEEEGVNAATGDVIVKVDPVYFRPTEVDLLLSDPAKARNVLGWEHKITFDQLVKDMVESDLALVRQENT